MASRPHKNNSGTYYLIWTDSSRKQVRKIETLKTKKLGEARKRANALEQLYDNGYHDPWATPWHQNPQIKGFVRSGVIDLQKLARQNTITGIESYKAIEEYIDFKSRKGIWGYDTALNNRRKLRRFERYCPVYINELSDEHIEDFFKGKSENYQVILYRLIRAFMNWAVYQNYMDQVIDYHLKKPHTKIPSIVTNEELSKACNDYLKRIKEIETKDYKTRDSTKLWIPLGWLCLRMTGMRPSELMNLRMQDVYLSENRILVGGAHTTKTRSQRFIDIQPETKPLFEFLLSVAYRNHDPVTAKSEYLLGRSAQINQNRMSIEFKKYSGKKLYWLKDTYAFWILLREGSKEYHLVYLRDQLGHSSIDVTDKYLKYAPKQKPELMDFTFLDDFITNVLQFINSI